MAAGQRILIELGDNFSRLLPSQVTPFLAEIKQAKRIFCIGAGRSRIILSAFCMRLNQLGLESYLAGNIPCPPALKGDLVIAASGSATTPSVNAILKRAKDAGARIVLLTATKDHDLGGLIDLPINIHAPNGLVNKDSKQPMRTLFEQICFILYESIIAVLSMNIAPEEIAARHTNLE